MASATINTTTMREATKRTFMVDSVSAVPAVAR
jgi:hypothetical protein